MGRHVVREIGRLPAPEDHAALGVLRGALYLVGGTRVLRIDPTTGRVSVLAKLPDTLQDPAVVATGRRLAIIGGGTSAVYELVRS